MGRFVQTLVTTAAALALLAGLTVAQENEMLIVQPNLHDGGNQWIITAFNAAGELATQRLCFLLDESDETTVRGYWYSDTFLGWDGGYIQEGNQIRMYGDYRRNRGHDGIVWSFTSEGVGTGEWMEWRENSRLGESIGFAQVSMERVGECQLHAPLPERPWDGSKLGKFLREVHKHQLYVRRLPIHGWQDNPMLTTLVNIEDELAHGETAPTSMTERERREQERREKRERRRRERERR